VAEEAALPRGAARLEPMGRRLRTVLPQGVQALRKVERMEVGEMTDGVVPYKTLHNHVRRLYGRPSLCEMCGTTEAGRFEWANVTGVYEIGRENWRRMCSSCHNRFDFTEEHKRALTRKGKTAASVTLERMRQSMRKAWREGRHRPTDRGENGRFIGHGKS